MRNLNKRKLLTLGLACFGASCWLALHISGASKLYAASNEPLRAVFASSTQADVFWAEPTDIAARDLFLGAGGKNGAPNLSNRFVEVRVSGGASGERVVEEVGAGRRWSLNTGPEAKAEVAASRLVWAVGYQVDQNYFARELQVANGGRTRLLKNVRLKRMSANVSPLGTWQWRSNPFVGTRQLQGLKVMMALLSNGDLRDENNRVVRLIDVNQRVFYVGNIKSTLGKTARLSGTAGNPSDYQNQKFIDKVRSGIVDFHNKGENSGVLDGVTVAEAQWMGEILGHLSDAQLDQAFRAGGFESAEVLSYRGAIKRRISELGQLSSTRNGK
jgi:hypothetical protein